MINEAWLRGRWGLIGLLLLTLGCAPPPPPKTAISSPAPSPPPPPELRYEQRTVGRSQIHLIVVPPGAPYTVTPAIAEGVSTVAELAQQTGAIAAINGGYFDPVNQKSASFVVKAGKTVANPQSNERLVQNPQLAPNLSRILSRTTFRRYRCAGQILYDIAPGGEIAPTGCRLLDELGAGPALLPQAQLEEEAFLERTDGIVTRDPLGVEQPNARSAVGITGDGSVILVMVAQKPEIPGASGMTLTDLATLLRDLGAVKAMNLDGGTSSALFYRGTTYHGKVNATGERIWRPIKTALVVQDNRITP